MGGEAILKMGLRNWRAPHIFLAHGVQGLHNPGDLGLETPQAAVIGVRRQAEITRIFDLREEAVVPAIKRLRLSFGWNRPTRHLFLREEQVLESTFNIESQQTIICGTDAQGRRQRLDPTDASEAASQECFFFKILQDERGNSWAFGIWPFSACQLENGNYPVCVSCKAPRQTTVFLDFSLFADGSPQAGHNCESRDDVLRTRVTESHS